jgi:hypothetical protein
MTKVIQSRFDEPRLSKLAVIQAKTGLTASALFRRLIDAAEVEPAKIAVDLSTNANSDVTTLQGSHVADAANYSISESHL